MKALSIKQPWAWLIVHGYKDIENRTFDSPRCGRIYVHAGKTTDDDGMVWLLGNKYSLKLQDCMAELLDIYSHWHQSMIVGEVDIEYVTMHSESPWFTGPIGYVLKNPLAYEKPIPYKGKLGFFEVEL